MVRASGYLQTLDDFRKIPLMTTEAGVPVRVGDVVHVQIGPEMRRGITELDGDGEVVGGVIVMRSGDAGNHDPVQATRSMAGRHDNRQAGRRAGSDRQGAGIVQHLGAADQQPHRHAGDRHQEPGRHQGGGARILQEIDRITRDIERVVKSVPGVSSALVE